MPKERLYLVKKSVTGAEPGEKVPASRFVQPGRLVRKGVLVPTAEYTDTAIQPREDDEDTDYRAECESLGAQCESLMDQLAEANRELDKLRADSDPSVLQERDRLREETRVQRDNIERHAMEMETARAEINRARQGNERGPTFDHRTEDDEARASGVPVHSATDDQPPPPRPREETKPKEEGSPAHVPPKEDKPAHPAHPASPKAPIPTPPPKKK